MTTQSYYRYCMTLPFALPIALGLAAAALRAAGFSPDLLEMPFGLLGAATMLGGAPYLAVAGYYFFRLRGQPPATYRRTAWRVPVPFAVLMAAAFALISGMDGIALPDMLKGIAWWGGLSLAFGYFYVLLAQGGRTLFARAGWLRDGDRRD